MQHEQEIPFRQRLTCRIDEASAASGLSPLEIGLLIQKNEIEATVIEEHVLIIVPSLIARLCGSGDYTNTHERRADQARRSRFKDQRRGSACHAYKQSESAGQRT
jgi:hypothetical protein